MLAVAVPSIDGVIGIYMLQLTLNDKIWKRLQKWKASIRDEDNTDLQCLRPRPPVVNSILLYFLVF